MSNQRAIDYLRLIDCGFHVCKTCHKLIHSATKEQLEEIVVLKKENKVLLRKVIKQVERKRKRKKR